MENPKIDKLSDSRKVLNFDDVQGSNVNKQSKPTKNPPEALPDTSTGAIQKRKSALKSLKPSNSMKSSEGSHFFTSMAGTISKIHNFIQFQIRFQIWSH
jgi:hypothetical protein